MVLLKKKEVGEGGGGGLISLLDGNGNGVLTFFLPSKHRLGCLRLSVVRRIMEIQEN